MALVVFVLSWTLHPPSVKLSQSIPPTEKARWIWAQNLESTWPRLLWSGWAEGEGYSAATRRPHPQPGGAGGANLTWLKSTWTAPPPLENVPPLSPDIFQWVIHSLCWGQPSPNIHFEKADTHMGRLMKFLRGEDKRPIREAGNKSTQQIFGSSRCGSVG